MVKDESNTMALQDTFYRDNFGRIILIIISVFIAICLLVSVIVYFYVNKPPPINFNVENEWRIQASVPLNQPYLVTSDLLQWVSEVLPNAFQFDFINYNNQLKLASQYFTSDGWKAFLNQLNTYANYNNVQTYKMFINGVAAGAPFILNQGLLSGRYAWWVQMPIDINYTGYNMTAKQSLTLQVLVMRVPTLNNLSGVGIDNVVIVRSTGNAPAVTGQST